MGISQQQALDYIYMTYAVCKGHYKSMARYEEAKRWIQRMQLPHNEYEAAVKKLAKVMKV